MFYEDYERRVENEKKHYDKEKYGENLTEKTSSGLGYVLQKRQERIKKNTGYNIWEHIINTVNSKGSTGSEVQILSLGSGPGGVEINLAKHFTVRYSIDCFDINENSLAMGRNKATNESLRIKFVKQDLNKLKMQSEYYDVIIANASLHHMIEHEHISKEVKKGMNPDGLYFVNDVIVRNGMKMWGETKEIADKIFSLLPSKYRKFPLQNGDYEIIKTLPDKDVSTQSFECIRSQDLYPILKKNFKIKLEEPGFSFAKRFVAIPLGSNYNVEKNSFDKVILDEIIRLDEKFTVSNMLKPESIFLILEK